MDEIRPGVELWRLRLDDFLIWMERVRRLGKSTTSISKEISHLRSLIDYAWRSGRVERNALDGFKLKDLGTIVHQAPPVLTLEQARALISNCPRKSERDKRERLMVLLLYGCGLRTGELCALDAQDLDLERQELFIRKAKGDIQRRIPVPDGVWTECLAYLAERGKKRGALFRTEIKKTRISQKDVLLAVHNAGERAGLGDSIFPKMLRHSFATHLMDAGVDLALIASLMGHRTPGESGIYLHALPGRREAAVGRLTNVILPQPPPQPSSANEEAKNEEEKEN
jgi:integrase/recombinase XerD